jgi:hypothetical protein
MLAMNENPDAMNLMFNHLNELTINDWYSRITQNPSAEPLLFNLNYDKMKQIFQPIAKEIIEYVFHPTRVQRFADTAGIDVADYLEYF